MAAKAKKKVIAPEKSGEVVFLDTFTEIPPCDFPLQKVGQETYDEWCRTLLRTGRLTVKSLEYVQMLAVAKDAVQQALEAGKPAPGRAIDGMRSAMLKLEKVDADTAITTPQGSENIYATFGFAKSARAERHS